jgi:hypothetical protein
MSMNHKAYVFEDEAFDKELSVPLANALRKNDPKILLPFIDSHREQLKWKRTDPMPKDLHAWCMEEGVQQAGDLALTAFYDPEAEIGLGPAWHQMHELLDSIDVDAVGTLCGEPFVARVVFNPGGLGAYFQTADEVWGNRDGLKSILRRNRKWVPIFAPASAMLETALQTGNGKGLFVWF